MTQRQRIILAVLMCAEVVSAFESSMVLAGLTSWIQIFGSPVHVGWIVTAYMLVSAASAALCGRLGDLFGRKTVLLIVIAVTMIGSIVSASGPSLGWIIAGRAIQGLAGAIIPLCYGLVREHLPAERVPFGVGMIVATAAAASAIGLLLGGILTDHYGPQSIFIASAAAAAGVLIIVIVALPRSTTVPLGGTIDWVGGILFAPGVGMVLLAISNLQQWGVTNPLSLLLLFAGIALLAIWYRHEKNHVDPLIDVRLLANRNCLVGNLVMVCAASGVMQFTQLTSMLLQQPVWTVVGLGTTATLVGLVKFPAVAAGLVSSIWAGSASGRHGGQYPMLVGCAAMTVASASGAFLHSSIFLIVIVVTAANMGVTAAYTGIPNVIIAASPQNRTSEATGLMSVVRAMSQAIGAQLLAVVLAASTVTSEAGKTFPDETSYKLAFLMMGTLSAAGFALSLFIRRPATIST